MKIKVIYFAAMREQAKVSEEVIETKAINSGELFTELNTKYNFKIDRNHLKVAINETYSSFETEINEMDTIVFIPPVAGG